MGRKFKARLSCIARLWRDRASRRKGATHLQSQAHRRQEWEGWELKARLGIQEEHVFKQKKIWS